MTAKRSAVRALTEALNVARATALALAESLTVGESLTASARFVVGINELVSVAEVLAATGGSVVSVVSLPTRTLDETPRFAVHVVTTSVLITMAPAEVSVIPPPL